MANQTAIIRRIETALTIDNGFVAAALALPTKLETALNSITDIAVVREWLSQVEGYEAYGARIRADNSVMQAIGASKLLLIAKFGELLPKGKKGAGRGHKKPDMACPIFPASTGKLYRKVAKHKAALPEYREELQADPDMEVSIAGFLRYVGSGPNLAGKHTGEMEWYTPERYVEAARTVLGEIDLDPASTKLAQKTVKAAQFYTADDDGLAHDWSGRVFLNPPYKMPEIRQFVEKLCDSYDAKQVAAAILLTNDQTDTQWWQRACHTAALVCLHAGRISFYNAAGDGSAPTNGQTFFYMGNAPGRFKKVFAEFGTIVTIA